MESTAVTSDFNVFVRLLTSQVKNQDPFDPLDASKFASQLATFSMVEQQVIGNDRLEKLGQKLDSAQFSDLAAVLGQKVSYRGEFRSTGQPVELTLDRSDHAGGALEVRDSRGNFVTSYQVPAGTDRLYLSDLDNYPSATDRDLVASFMDVSTDTPIDVFVNDYANMIKRGANGAEIEMVSGVLVSLEDVVGLTS